MLGALFARAALRLPLSRLPRQQAGHELVIALQGALGAGKTTFAQGFARGLGILERVMSPTFIISRRSVIPRHSRFKSFFHIDCYRLRKPADLLSVGWRDIAKDPSNIIVLEWPERVSRLLPKDVITLKFSYAKGKNTRTINLLTN